MKGPVIERLTRDHVLPVLPGFVARRSLVYRRPIDYFLYGLSFDTSSFASARLFVHAFIQPLYAPVDGVVYTYGFRLGEGDFWDVDEQVPDRTFAAIALAAEREALPFFDKMTGLDRFCELVPKWVRERPKHLLSAHSLDDPVITEDLGYTEILRGRKDDGVRLLEATIASEREAGEDASDERIAHSQQILEAVSNLGLEGAQALLEQWRAETIRNLRLEE